MYVNLYGNSTAYQCLYMLQDLKLGQYTKLPPRATFAAQMAGSIIGSIFNYTSKYHLSPTFSCSRTGSNFEVVMITIVNNNRAALIDPVGTRVVSSPYRNSTDARKAHIPRSGVVGLSKATTLHPWP